MGRLLLGLRRDRLVQSPLLTRTVLLTGSAVAVAHHSLPPAVLAATLAGACGTPADPALAPAMPGIAGSSRRRATDLLVTMAGSRS